MKKFLSVLLILSLGAAMLLSSCGGQKQQATADEAGKAAADATSAVTEPTQAPPAEPPTEKPAETTAPTEPADIAKDRLEEILSMSDDELPDKASVDVEELYQMPELPTGCEAVALTIAMNAFGCGLSKTEIASDYLVMGDDMVTSYVGDPFSYGGAGIFPPGLVRTAERCIDAKGFSLCAFDVSDTQTKDLYKLIASGSPVVVWVTYYMNDPVMDYDGQEYGGRLYRWYINEHCACLYAYDRSKGTVWISDPLWGKVEIDVDEFEYVYDTIGRFALTLIDPQGGNNAVTER